MRKIIKWGIIIIVSGLIIWFWSRYRKCKKKGEESRRVYECNPFANEPSFLNAEEVRWKILEGKCYEITDYGKKMSFREVEEIKCTEQVSAL